MTQSLIVKLNIKNSQTASKLKEAVTAVPGFAIADADAACDVLILEIGYEPDDEFRLIEQLQSKKQAREIFLISPRKDPDVLLRALKLGVKEFFPQPLKREDVIAALKKIRPAAALDQPQTAAEKKGVVISVIGCRGGVGATTAAVNLAVCIKELEKHKAVVLMDLNSLPGGVPLFLDVKTSFTWSDAARDIGRMDATYLLNSLFKHSAGVHVLPAPVGSPGSEAATPEVMEKLIARMRTAFDVIVVDNSRSLDGVSLRTLAASDIIVLLSELNLPAVLNARALLNVFEHTGVSYGKDIKVVMNRFQKKNIITPEEAEHTLGTPIFYTIPNDYETTMAAINNGQAICHTGLKAPILGTFRELAGLLLRKEIARTERKTFTDLMKSFKIRTGLLPRREAMAKEGIIPGQQ